jgi:hypothetical protein
MTPKNYYFHRVTKDMLEMTGEEGLFSFGGEYWFYKMEVNYEDGCIRIYDTVGRMLPIDLDTVNTMLGALTMVDSTKEAIKMAETMHETTKEVLGQSQEFGLLGQFMAAIAERSSPEYIMDRAKDYGFSEMANGMPILVNADGTTLTT